MNSQAGFRVTCNRCGELLFATIPALDLPVLSKLYEHVIECKKRPPKEPPPPQDALGILLRFFDVVRASP